MRMRLGQLLGLAAFLLVFTFQGCLKTDNLPQLEVLVISESGIPAAGAYVALFDNLDEWNGREHPVQAWRTTDANGKVLFTDLKEMEYFVYVRLEGKDNSLSEISTGSTLVMNQRTKLVVHIR